MTEHQLSPGKLVISVEGVQSLADLQELDVRSDRVAFVANGALQTVHLGCDAIDVETCSARFKRKRLELSWHNGASHPAAAKHEVDAGGESFAPPPRDRNGCGGARPPACAASAAAAADGAEQTVAFRFQEAVSWALRQLELLRIPEGVSGFERFKAEVGLAELALYASRCCRLAVPEVLWSHLQAAEKVVHEALAARAAGEEPEADAISRLFAALRRVSGAVADRRLDPPRAAPLGRPPPTAAAVLCDRRWTLRDGTALGPGVGTWKLTPEEAELRVVAALQHGSRHVDTAAEYGTEAAVARAIRTSGVERSEVFVTLKVAGESALELRRTLADSLRKWGAGPVDCLLMHRAPKAPEALAEVWDVLVGAVKDGRARCLGASNVTAAQLESLCKQHPEAYRPAIVQLKCSAFHQGGYFPEAGPSAMWDVMRRYHIVPVGVSLLNPLHSCVAPLEEPLLNAWAKDLAASPAELLAHWACSVGVCPLFRCSPGHAQTIFRSELVLPQRVVSAITAMSSLTETAFCPAIADPFGLRAAAGRRMVRSGEALRGRVVEVHGLGSSAGQQLNGHRGRLQGFDDDGGRWQVSVTGAVKKIRPDRLTLVEGATEPDDTEQAESRRGRAAEAAGRLLQDLLATGGVDSMLRALTDRSAEVTWAFEETVAANLANARARGWTVKQQVLARLLSAVEDIFDRRSPKPEHLSLPLPTLDLSAVWKGPDEAAARAVAAAVAALDSCGYAICDSFASPDEIERLATELSEYDEEFELSKIWVGKEAAGTQLSVPAVRSDRIFWVCGEHRTAPGSKLWDSAGVQPDAGLAPCRPEVTMSKPTHGFPELTAMMKRVDDLVLLQLAQRCSRLKGLAERSDAMVSIYADGARFAKHVDNPNKDGRVLTSIVYLNTGAPWRPEDGGELRLFLGKEEPPADFLPCGGRLVLFWADQLPHEVLPATRRRMALTYWWFDRSEREAKLQSLAEHDSIQLPAKLPTHEEVLAQDFIAHMLSEGSTPSDIVARARKLPPKAMIAVAEVVGAQDGEQAMEGLERLTEADLERLRGSMGKMGLD